MSATGGSIVEHLAALAAMGATPHGIDRRLFSAADREARRLFARWALSFGCSVAQDAAGNVFARKSGARENAPPIVCGSHLDTVPTGGWLDGAYGVAAALHAFGRIAGDGVVTEHPLEAVAWAGEEGSRFPLGCLGSGVYAGLNDLAAVEALVDDAGERFDAIRNGPHGLLQGVPLRERGPAPAAYLEIHIEQGPILEHHGARLGIVTAIAGQARFEIDLRGEAGHAGTVPMTMRHDALAAAAEMVVALEAAAAPGGDAVLTVGRLVVEPNQTNVIPGRVTFRVDARSGDESRLRDLSVSVAEVCRRIAARRGVAIDVAEIERRAVVPMDPRLRATVAGAIAPLGVAAMELPSGAGHDAMCVAAIAPAAMIFVPSIGGRSHVAAEDTSTDDLELGIAALARSIVAVDRMLSKEM